MRFLPVVLALATTAALPAGKSKSSTLGVAPDGYADGKLDLIGVRTPGAHEGRTNPDAVQDGWPDCSVPDDANNYYTQCAPTPDYFTKPADAPRIVVLGSSFTAGVGSGHKEDTWPSQLGALLPMASVTNFGAGASTVLKVSSGGPGDLSFWERPQFRAFKNNTWDLVLIVLGHNDAKTAFWPKSCSDEATMLTCPVATDLMELINIAKSRGRNGAQAKVLVAQEGDPSCCMEGARTCSDHSGPPGCAYCVKCEGTFSVVDGSGKPTAGVDSEVRMVKYPLLLRKVAAAANVPFSDALPRASPETPPDQCRFDGPKENEFGPALAGSRADNFRHMIQSHQAASGTCMGGSMPVPPECPYRGRCCNCHAGKHTDGEIAKNLVADFAHMGFMPPAGAAVPPIHSGTE